MIPKLAWMRYSEAKRGIANATGEEKIRFSKIIEESERAYPRIAKYDPRTGKHHVKDFDHANREGRMPDDAGTD